MAWAPLYVTADDLAVYERIPDDVDDAQLALAVAAAARAVDNTTGRQFGKTDALETRRYRARPDFTTGYWTVDIDDVHAAAGLVVTIGGVAVTTYDLAPWNAAPRGRPWTQIEFTADSQALPSAHPYRVDVASQNFGWAAIPDAVKEATLLQAARFATRRQAPFGIAGSPDAGSEMRLLAKVDPDVAVALMDYRRMRAPG